VSPPGPDEIAESARALWSGGHYETVAEHLRPASRELVEACGIGPGERVLDVGAGSGNTTIEAAARGAAVTASDLTPAMIAMGSARTRAEGLDVPWVEADAQALPFPDGSFDVAVSVFGAIFAPDHARAAAEMVRVVRPGGRVALAAWTPVGFNRGLSRLAAEFVPMPPGAPDPNAWGDPETARARFAAAGLEVRTEARRLRWVFPSPEDFVRYLEEDVPPFAAARAALGEGYPPMRRALVELVSAENTGDSGAVIDASWLLVVGTTA
jgi:ubiquinone/menaquinone biosynthesis C-methylase UbiE